MEFKIKTDRPFLNCGKVHPLQQKKVRELVDVLSSDSSVRLVKVFGSSVSDRCHVGSDIDIYVDMDYDHYPINKALCFTYDLWHNFSVDERLMDEISRKGVTVYER